jgi:uncharacterized protein (DUF849 family)
MRQLNIQVDDSHKRGSQQKIKNIVKQYTSDYVINQSTGFLINNLPARAANMLLDDLEAIQIGVIELVKGSMNEVYLSREKDYRAVIFKSDDHEMLIIVQSIRELNFALKELDVS